MTLVRCAPRPRFWTSITLLVLLFLLIATVPVLAGAEPPPCDPAHDGLIWTQPESQIKFQCQYIQGFGWGWHAVKPTPPEEEGNAHTYWGSSLAVANIVAVGGFDFGSASFAYSQTGDGETLLQQPAGWIATRTVLQYWTGSVWAGCTDSGWHYNSYSTKAWSVGSYTTTPPCGNAYYHTLGYGMVWDGSLWRGGSILSPSLLFSLGFAPLTSMTPPPDAPHAIVRDPVPPPPPAAQPPSQ
jgi:hypothetical protein